MRRIIVILLAFITPLGAFSEPVPLAAISTKFTYDCDTLNDLPAIRKSTYNKKGALSNRKHYQGNAIKKLEKGYLASNAKLKSELAGNSLSKKERSKAKKKLKAQKLLLNDIASCALGDLNPSTQLLAPGPVSELRSEATFSSAITGSCSVVNQGLAGDAIDPSAPPVLSLVGGSLTCALTFAPVQAPVTFSLAVASGSEEAERPVAATEIVSFTSNDGNLNVPLCSSAPCDIADQIRTAVVRRGLRLTVSSGNTRASAVFR